MNPQTINNIVEIVLGIVILMGAIIAVISSFGIIRLPDVFLRSHAATKSATLAVLLILLGAFFYFWLFQDHISIRLLLGILFVFLTSPIAGHLIARTAYRSGEALWKGSVRDELKEAINREKREKVKEQE